MKIVVFKETYPLHKEDLVHTYTDRKGKEKQNVIHKKGDPTAGAYKKGAQVALNVIVAVELEKARIVEILGNDTPTQKEMNNEILNIKKLVIDLSKQLSDLKTFIGECKNAEKPKAPAKDKTK